MMVCHTQRVILSAEATGTIIFRSETRGGQMRPVYFRNACKATRAGSGCDSITTRVTKNQFMNVDSQSVTREKAHRSFPNISQNNDDESSLNGIRAERDEVDLMY